MALRGDETKVRCIRTWINDSMLGPTSDLGKALARKYKPCLVIASHFTYKKDD